MSARAKKHALDLVAVVLSVLVCEAGFRIAGGVPVFQDTSFRNSAGHRGRDEQAVGLRPGPRDGALSRISGVPPTIRRCRASTRSSTASGATAPTRRPVTGGTLVVGGSFAAGSGVPDHETWPAFLERMIGEPVLNAAVGGYGMDQTVLRAEQLLPILRPKTLIVEAWDSPIQWTSYSRVTRPKPYFTVENGRLAHHHSPVPTFAPSKFETTRLKDLLGHSIVIDNMMAKLAPDAWYASGQNVTTRIQSDEVEVTCRLLARLKEAADRHEARVLLFAHVVAPEVIGHDAPPSSVQLVSECAEAARIQVAAAFPRFKALEQADPAGFRRYFLMQGDAYGHNSAEGNLEIAKVLASALARPFDGVRAAEAGSADQDLADATPGGPRNLIPTSESLGVLLPSNAICKVEAFVPDDLEPSRARLAATGTQDEHYLGMSPILVPGGPMTLSFEVRPENASAMRLQLLQGEHGILADLDLAGGGTATVRIGKTRQLSAGIQAVEDGWSRVWVGGTFPGGPTAVRFQLLGPDGVSRFEPGGQAIVVRKLQLERGRTASAYQATSGPLSQGFLPGDGRNLLPSAESLVRTSGPSGARLEAQPRAFGWPNTYRLSANRRAGRAFRHHGRGAAGRERSAHGIPRGEADGPSRLAPAAVGRASQRGDRRRRPRSGDRVRDPGRERRQGRCDRQVGPRRLDQGHPDEHARGRAGIGAGRPARCAGALRIRAGRRSSRGPRRPARARTVGFGGLPSCDGGRAGSAMTDRHGNAGAHGAGASRRLSLLAKGI